MRRALERTMSAIKLQRPGGVVERLSSARPLVTTHRISACVAATTCLTCRKLGDGHAMLAKGNVCLHALLCRCHAPPAAV